MKIIMIVFTLLLSNSLLILSQDSSSTKKRSLIEQELWQLEQTYMHYYKDKNIDSLITFYHKNFTGWPQWSDTPVDIVTGMEALKRPSETIVTDFNIRPQNIVLYDNIAIVYYYIDVEYETIEHNRKTVPTRLIHTWINENGKWQILGGMSNSSK